MASVERSIEVEVPVERVYDQWTQFDQFPMFMEGLRDVRRLDARQVLWRAEVMGRVRQWRAEITEQVPEQRIAWRSRSGAPGAGLVTFHRLTPDRTRVVLRMDHEPADPPETVAARIEGDLRRFKALIEARGEPTGWPDRVPRRPAFPARDAP